MAIPRTVLGVNVYPLFVCEQGVEICIGSLYKRSDEPAGPSSEIMVQSGPSGLASTSVLSAANAIPARTPTSCVSAIAGKCPYFVMKVLYSVLSLFLHLFTVDSSKTKFREMH